MENLAAATCHCERRGAATLLRAQYSARNVSRKATAVIERLKVPGEARILLKRSGDHPGTREL